MLNTTVTALKNLAKELELEILMKNPISSPSNLYLEIRSAISFYEKNHQACYYMY